MADSKSLDGSGSGSGKRSRRDKKSRVISYADACRLFETAMRNNVKREPAFFLELRTFIGTEGITARQRKRIRWASWSPGEIRGVDFVSAFVKVIWPICTDTSKVEAFFEQTSATEDGLIKQLVDSIFEYASYTKAPLDGCGDEWEDTRFPWYEWVFQSIRKSVTIASSDAFGLHVFCCWLTTILCRTFKCQESSTAVFGLSDLPMCVASGFSEFVKIYQSQAPNIDLLMCTIAIETIDAYIPKPKPVSPKKTPEIPSNEKRMETRSSLYQKRGIKPARQVNYTEDASDDEAINLTHDDEKKSHLEMLEDAIKRGDLAMREKESLMDKIVLQFDLEFAAQAKKVKALEAEYEAMLAVYRPVKDAVVRDKAGEKICKQTVESFKKIGRQTVEVQKVRNLFKVLNPFFVKQRFTPGVRPVIKRKQVIVESSKGNDAISEAQTKSTSFVQVLTPAAANVKLFQPKVILKRCDLSQTTDTESAASSSNATEMDAEISKDLDSTPSDDNKVNPSGTPLDGTQPEVSRETLASITVPTLEDLISSLDDAVPVIYTTDEERNRPLCSPATVDSPMTTAPGTTNPDVTRPNEPIVMLHAAVTVGSSTASVQTLGGDDTREGAPSSVIESIQNEPGKACSMTSAEFEPSAAFEKAALEQDSSPVTSFPEPTTGTGVSEIVDPSIKTSTNDSTLVSTEAAVSGDEKSEGGGVLS